MDIILKHLSWIGTKPICNGYLPHAITIGNFCFPLCQRCTSIFIGMIIGFYVYNNIPEFRTAHPLIFVTFIPILIDGFCSNYLGLDNGILLRCASGILFGIGFDLLIIKICNFVINILEKK